MATQHSRSAARIMMAPAVILLLGWMLVPLTMTVIFSFKKYLPLRGGDLGWVGFDNYVRFVSSSTFWPSVQATLVIVGGIFVLEALSVILQVGSFKLRGKRIFKMAPLHHHFELKGWPEPRVIVRFWIITVMLVLLGLASLKLR